MIECCTVLVKRSITSSLPSFAKYKNVNISKMKKRSIKEITVLLTLKSLSCKQLLLFFYYIDTLRHPDTSVRESSFNMTRGDEDIEGGAPKIFRHPKGGALEKL